MNAVNEHHSRAMEFADLAFLARRGGEKDEAIRLFRLAYEQEAIAADLVRDTSVEPTRSVLHRSAASLALECDEVREAEKLIAYALAGEPPEAIAQELRTLLEKANFHRHLALNQISLQPGELQLTLVGGAISEGMALTDAVIQRITKLDKLIQRTAERLSGFQYRDRGGPAKAIADKYSLWMSAPKAGSINLVLRLGAQSMLPGFDDTGSIIDEMMECLLLVNDREFDLLEQKIPDGAYYRQFVGASRAVAPDGQKVNLVGLTAVKDGQEKTLRFSTTQDELHPPAPIIEVQSDEVAEFRTIKGRLRYADSLRDDDAQIRLIDEQGNAIKIFVPQGLMSDIVKPLWDETVVVKGMQYRNRFVLHEIFSVEG